jgi:hypothetical protein
MKALSLFLIPPIALLVSACASGPPVAVYGGGPDYGPGPSPRSGYYWNGSVYIQGPSPYYHNNQYSRNVTDVNDRTVNNSTVNDRTVNRTNVDKTNARRTAVLKPKNDETRKAVQNNGNNPQGNPQG